MNSTKAVLCPAHAVFLGGDPTSDAAWSLESFQAGETRFYLEHLQRAISLTAADNAALLILSGGQTRAQAGRRSESRGYLEAAQTRAWFGHPGVAQRTLVEEFARDSFENLLFGICRFREHTRHYPRHVSIAGWAFKRERFGLHREAIGWPADRFEYVGVNQPVDLEEALRGERRALEEFRCDPFGQSGALQAKRARRNPFGQRHPYFLDTIAITTETAS